jgi:Family of unknown function (DUF6516)
MKKAEEHTLEFLLAFDGRIHHLEQGYWLKFEIKRVESTQERPHGLRYSFTLHDPGDKRLVGFDNAHGTSYPGSRFKAKASAYDHWHRTEGDKGRPYRFTDADTLLVDFFAEVRRVLAAHGVSDDVIRDDDVKRRSR